jgi:hypothetical protein
MTLVGLFCEALSKDSRYDVLTLFIIDQDPA